MKYFDIHVNFTPETRKTNGYSIFVECEGTEADALMKAEKEHLFTSDGDIEDIDYIYELSESEYKMAIGA